MKVFLKKYKFTILAMIVILIPLLMPVPEIDIDIAEQSINNFEYIDKIVHIFIFFILSLITFKEKGEKTLKCMLVLCLYALLTEILQKLTGYRSFELYDVVADIIGIMCGSIIMKKNTV